MNFRTIGELFGSQQKSYARARRSSRRSCMILLCMVLVWFPSMTYASTPGACNGPECHSIPLPSPVPDGYASVCLSPSCHDLSVQCTIDEAGTILSICIETDVSFYAAPVATIVVTNASGSISQTLSLVCDGGDVHVVLLDD